MKLKTIFCLVLAAALLCGVLAVTGLAAGADLNAPDVKVENCSTHTAALFEGDLYLWGTNEAGQFPKSKLAYSVEPVKLLTGVQDVAVSDGRTLVLMENGTLYSYGTDPLDDSVGQIKQIFSGVAQVSCDEDFALFVTKKGALWAWGKNQYGQLGTGDTEDSAAPVCIIESGVKKAVAGHDFALALLEDGSVLGWGLNEGSQLNYTLSDGTVPETVTEPVEVLSGGAKDIDAGYSFSCILKNDGTLWTCGQNELSQLGINSLDSSAGLTKILDGIRSVSVGDNYGFAMGNGGQIFSWGFGVSGQLGDGTRERIVGAAPAEIGDYVQVFAGRDATFGLDSSGALYAWGTNSNMVLGQRLGNDSTAPTMILTSDLHWAFEGEPAEAVTPEGKPVVEPIPSDDDNTEEPDEIEEILAFVSGYPDGTFQPDSETTRAEFLTMLVKAVGGYDAEESYGTPTFADTDPTAWYASFVAYAQKTGLVAGYKDNTFRPDNTITRAEAAAMTAAAMGLTSDATESTFTDVSGWAVGHVDALAQKGILSGYKDGTFRPDNNIVRSEAVTVVAHAAGFDADSEATAAALKTAENPFTDVPATSWAYPYILRAAGLVG